MSPTKIKTSSEAQSLWNGEIIQGSDTLEVAVDGKDLGPTRCPSADSLERRHKTSDQGWLEDWLTDDTDPTQTS